MSIFVRRGQSFLVSSGLHLLNSQCAQHGELMNKTLRSWYDRPVLPVDPLLPVDAAPRRSYSPGVPDPVLPVPELDPGPPVPARK